MRIVHEDDDVLVVDKPSGLLTANLPGETRDSVFDAVKDYIRGGRRRPERVWIIHRLDKEVSGLLVFAKSERAFHWLKEDFRSRRTHRLYAAVVEGEVRPEETQPGAASPARADAPLAGTIQSYLIEEDSGDIRSVDLGGLASAGFGARGARGPGVGGRRGPETRPDRNRTGTPGPGPRGRPEGGPRRPAEGEPRLAVTHWRVVHAGHGRTQLQLRLETGRKNQIRVHMSQWGHPVCGDRRFGAHSDPIGRVALHAAELGFSHPGTGQAVRFSSPIPASFHKLVGRTPPAERPAADQPVAAPASPTSWDHVAAWYDRLIDEQKSDLYHEVIAPGTLRLLSPRAGMRVLDIACGQGDLSRRLAELGAEVVGVDAAPRLIEAAKRRAAEGPGASPTFLVGDAAALTDPALGLAPASFDAAACVMALMNIQQTDAVARGVAALLKPGGSFVAVILHPAFRAPGQTSWGWEPASRPSRDERGRGEGSAGRQYRRVDGYLTPDQSPIVMNPGAAAGGAEPVTTTTFHRPIQAYVKALADAGLLIGALEEWPSARTSQPGPRAAEENRARREIPMFLAIRAVLSPVPGPT